MSEISSSVRRVGPTPARLGDLQLCQTLKSALGLRFNLRSQQFRFQTPGQTHGTDISEDALFVLISATLGQQPELFPASQIRHRRLKRIIHLLRALCADADEDGHRSLEQFVQTRLELQPGSDVTSGEVYKAFEASALHTGDSILTQFEFYRCLPALIKGRFGKLKLHEIERPNKDLRLTKRNGWRGLKLTDGTDSTDGTDTSLHLPP